nr:MAG TPA_asm: hypothetical protein [Caudoviricetes sp.]
MPVNTKTAPGAKAPGCTMRKDVKSWKKIKRI